MVVIKYLFLIMLLAVGASALDTELDSVRQARVMVYSLMGLDTTGTSKLATGTVDGYVDAGIRKTNEDLLGYKRNAFIVSSAYQRLYVLDSMIEIRACFWYTHDSTIALKYINLEEAADSVSEVVNISSDDRPTHYFRWEDSVGFFPVIAEDNDSFWVFYYALLPADSISLMKVDYRMGVVFYAAYLAAIDTKVDPTPYITSYKEFIATKRRGAVEEK